ncbi:MAG: AN1-type zinc finger domain-containing protein [Nitrososphaerota archaeon]
MARCSVCGKEILMPFKCSYCGDYFCAEHRLPEKHYCPGIFAAASPYEKERKSRVEIEEWMPPRPVSRLSPSARDEIIHLSIGTMLVVLVGFSIIGYNFRIPPIFLAAYATGFAASFLIHELAHRSYARSKGLYAKFKLDPMGAILTLVTSIPFIPFKIIAPGAVVIFGLAPIDVLGMTALIGPLSNIALSAIFAIAGLAIPTLARIFLPLSLLNAFIALFNLIPLGELDGRKILAWSPSKWAISFALSIILLITTGFMFYYF